LAIAHLTLAFLKVLAQVRTKKGSHLEYQRYHYNHNAKGYENVIRGISNCVYLGKLPFIADKRAWPKL
jgi:hypothetical protein